jgi:hypothetical protein
VEENGLRSGVDGAAALAHTRRVTLIEKESASDELGPGWSEEIVRRIRAVERGESRLIAGAEVAAHVRKVLRMKQLR